MKHIIYSLLISCIAALAASAAQPIVVIDTSGAVLVDGVNYGLPADAIANNKALAAAIQTALSAYIVAVKTEAAAQRDAAIRLAQRERDAAIAKVEAERQSAKAELQIAIDRAEANANRISAHKAHRAQLLSYIAGLRGALDAKGVATEAPPAAPAP